MLQLDKFPNILKKLKHEFGVLYPVLVLNVLCPYMLFVVFLEMFALVLVYCHCYLVVDAFLALFDIHQGLI